MNDKFFEGAVAIVEKLTPEEIEVGLRQAGIEVVHSNIYGCPNTEMRTRQVEFEQANPGLNFLMCFNAPHYASKATRIAYYNWELNVNRN